MAKSRGRKFAEITSPSSGVFDLTSVPTITNAKLQNSAMTLAGSSVSLGGTGVADTDALSEGSSNLYFTDARVQTFLGGGTLAGNIVVPDNRSIYVGSQSDFRIIHNTTNTQLTNTTGALQITSSGALALSGSYVAVTGATTFSADLTVDTDTLKVDSTNNRVGIGTTNPATELHVDGKILTAGGTASSPALQLNDVNSGLFAPGGNIVAFSTDGSERMRIDSSGNVGIGRTPTAVESAYDSIQLGAGGIFLSGSSNLGAGNFGQNYYVDTSGNTKYIGNDEANRIFMNNGFIRFESAPTNSSGAGAALTFVENMRIDSNGNVGIGDPNPSEKLNVAGHIMLEGGNQYLYLTNVGTGNSGIYVRGNTAGSYLRSHSTGTFTWEVTGSQKMELDSNGNLGIGVTPSASHYETLELGTVGCAITGRGAADTHILSGLYWDGASTRKYAVSGVPVGTYQITNGAHYWSSPAAGTAGNTATVSANMALLASGELLHGTTTVPTGVLLGNQLVSSSATGAEIIAFRADTSVSVGDKTGAFLTGNSDTDGVEDHFVGMYGKVISTNGAQNLHFVAGRAGYENDDPNMTIESGGNVGIGTDNPDAILNVDCGAPSSSDKTLGLFQSQTSRQIGFVWDDSASTLGIATLTNHNLVFHINGNSSEKMRLDTSGNLGIGATSVGARLEVRDNSSNNYSTSIRLSQGYNSVYSTIASNFGGDLTLDAGVGAGSVAKINFKVDGDLKGKFEDDGDLIVGPYVYNSTSGIRELGSQGRIFTDFSANSAGFEVLLFNNRTVSGLVSIIQYRINAQVEGDLRGNASGLSIVNNSDYRKKKNIRDLTGSLNIIKQLQPRLYEYREEFGKPEGDYVGFIAHEIQEHIPSMVDIEKDAVYTQEDIDAGTTEHSVGDPKYQAVAYSNNEMITRLVQAMQEQQAMIEALQAEVAVLKGE